MLNDEDKRCDFLERTWMTYFDYQPVLRQIMADLFADLDTTFGKAGSRQRPAL